MGGVTERTEHYERHVLELGEEVARHALATASVDPADVNIIVSVSCTGYLLPSLDVYLIQHLDLDPSARRLPITELGCSGGVAAMALASTLLDGGSAGVALIVSVELCSLCVQTKEPSDTDVIGNVLFGDAGAAAVVASGQGGHGPAVLASQTVLWPHTTEMLGMRLTDTGFRLVLSPDLPDAVRRHLPPTVRSFLQARAISVGDLSFWIVHPGGPKVLDAVGAGLELPDGLLEPSWNVLERCGNVSSASVFLILNELREHSPPSPGALGMVLAFGPGLSCEMVLLRAQGWLTRPS